MNPTDNPAQSPTPAAPSPATTSAPVSGAPVPGGEHSLLERRIAVLEQANATLAATPKPTPKDRWDKFGLLVPLMIALVGAWFTAVYQKSQAEEQTQLQAQNVRLARVQAVAQLLPYLASRNEDQKQVAIEAMYAIADAEISAKLARLHPSTGTYRALLRLRQNPLVQNDSVVFAYAINNFPHDQIMLRPADPRTFTPERLDSIRKEAVQP
jgi:hypothetical protein